MYFYSVDRRDREANATGRHRGPPGCNSTAPSPYPLEVALMQTGCKILKRAKRVGEPARALSFLKASSCASQVQCLSDLNRERSGARTVVMPGTNFDGNVNRPRIQQSWQYWSEQTSTLLCRALQDHTRSC